MFLRTSIPLLLLAIAAGACDTPSDPVPGTVDLTVRVNANCAGIADTVDVTLTNTHFVTVVAGGDSYTKAIAPLRYDITAESRNGAKTWTETKTILSDYTYECGCP
jgi:hypothetical protein